MAGPLSRRCCHLAQLSGTKGTELYRKYSCHASLTSSSGGSTNPSARPRIKLHPTQLPSCLLCGVSKGRLYVCLACSAVCCHVAAGRPTCEGHHDEHLNESQQHFSEGERARAPDRPLTRSHVASHATSAGPGHEVFLDLERAELFCGICMDQVYDSKFDELVLLQLARARDVRAAAPKRKRSPRNASGHATGQGQRFCLTGLAGSPIKGSKQQPAALTGQTIQIERRGGAAVPSLGDPVGSGSQSDDGNSSRSAVDADVATGELSGSQQDELSSGGGQLEEAGALLPATKTVRFKLEEPSAAGDALHDSRSGRQKKTSSDSLEQETHLAARMHTSPEAPLQAGGTKENFLEPLPEPAGNKRRGDLDFPEGFSSRGLNGLPRGLRGLNNLGNTCFMNSVLQALLHTPPLRNFFLNAARGASTCPQHWDGSNKETILGSALPGEKKWADGSIACSSIHGGGQAEEDNGAGENSRAGEDNRERSSSRERGNGNGGGGESSGSGRAERGGRERGKNAKSSGSSGHSSKGLAPPKVCLGCEMDGVFSAAFCGDTTPFSPAKFLYSWWRHAESLACYQQQDAHEFFITTVNGLHGSSGLASPHRATGHGGVVMTECGCVIHRAFSGLLQSDVTCTVCGNTSTTYDPCVDISLDMDVPAQKLSTDVQPVRGRRSSEVGGEDVGSSERVPEDTPPLTLVGCLERFTRIERLGSKEKFFCESCEAPQESLKQMSIRKLPLVLCLHIKRFEHSSSRSGQIARKLDDFVKFPLSLNMMPFLSSSIAQTQRNHRSLDAPLALQGLEGGGGETQLSPKGPLEGMKARGTGFEGVEESSWTRRKVNSSDYELFAVVTHSGKIDSGHYVTFLRLGEGWYKCDDAWIIGVDEAMVESCQAYLLYFVQSKFFHGSKSSEG